MPWRRYWPGLVLAVPLGALLGAGAGHLLYIARTGWGSWNALTQSGAVIGALTALLAALGAVGGVWWQYHRSGDDFVLLPLVGAMGASLGASALFLLFGLIFTVLGGLAVLPLAILLAVVSGLTAGLVCTACMVAADQIVKLRSRSGKVA